MQMYSRDEWGGGEPLDQSIQERWGIFNPDLVESGKAASLLTHIMAAVWDDDDGSRLLRPVSCTLFVRRLT